MDAATVFYINHLKRIAVHNRTKKIPPQAHIPCPRGGFLLHYAIQPEPAQAEPLSLLLHSQLPQQPLPAAFQAPDQ